MRISLEPFLDKIQTHHATQTHTHKLIVKLHEYVKWTKIELTALWVFGMDTKFKAKQIMSRIKFSKISGKIWVFQMSTQTERIKNELLPHARTHSHVRHYHMLKTMQKTKGIWCKQNYSREKKSTNRKIAFVRKTFKREYIVDQKRATEKFTSQRINSEVNVFFFMFPRNPRWGEATVKGIAVYSEPLTCIAKLIQTHGAHCTRTSALTGIK